MSGNKNSSFTGATNFSKVGYLDSEHKIENKKSRFKILYTSRGNYLIKC